jgi:hypothetical protein
MTRRADGKPTIDPQTLRALGLNEPQAPGER